MEYMALPMILRQVRLSQGLTQRTVANHLGINSNKLCAKEMGRESMNLRHIEMYAQFLGYELTLCVKR
jgi:transcriptional regulator with XRE-family HTH domain